MSTAPPTVSQYVLKVHSRCDLACDHCYVYEHADQSWRKRPNVIEPATVAAAASRIAEHAAARNLPQVHVVLHGGEPLLLGRRRLQAVLDELVKTISPVTTLRLAMQTNGVSLTAPICELLLEYGVRVGVSLDGAAEHNDRHRRFANGATSHPQVLAALSLLRRPEFRHIYGGILCTVDIRNDPLRVYEALLEHEPPRIDFLLPHATWDTPPPRPEKVNVPYAQWLLRVHARWRSDGMPVAIRIFDSLESLTGGGRSESEAFGLDPADLVVIETDGAWEQVDSLKVAFDGAAATNLTVFAHSVDEVAGHPAIRARMAGADGLCGECRRCPVVRQCGGGLYPHRYRTGRGFDNPSVYCADLMSLITGIQAEAGSRLFSQPITSQMLADLATGHGNSPTIRSLADSQRDLVRSLLKAVGRRIARADAVARSGWLALNSLYEHAEDVLTHPFLRAWAVRCLQEMRSGNAAGAAYLASVAAAMAIRAGADVTISVPSLGNTINLPGLGRMIHDELADSTTLSIADGRFTAWDKHGRPRAVRPSEADGAWQPVRSVLVSNFSVALDDVDAYRDFYATPVAGRLPAEDAIAWQASLVEACAGIVRDAPAYQSTLEGLLRAVVPLSSAVAGTRSAAYREAFGAVAIAWTADPDSLGALLLHELQHVKLGAVLDFCPLTDPEFIERVSVPWRRDPRPIEAVLQGTYAHLGLADLHRGRQARRPESSERYRTYRQWTMDGIAAMRDAGGLNPEGSHFVEIMAQTVHGWEIAA